MLVIDTANGEKSLSQLAHALASKYSTVTGNYPGKINNRPSGAYISYRHVWIAVGDNPPIVGDIPEYAGDNQVWLDTGQKSPTYLRFYTTVAGQGHRGVWKTFDGDYDSLINFINGSSGYRLSPYSQQIGDDSFNHGGWYSQPDLPAKYQDSVSTSTCHDVLVATGAAFECNAWVEKQGRFFTFYSQGHGCSDNVHAVCLTAYDFLSNTPNGLFVDDEGGISLNLAQALQSDSYALTSALLSVIQASATSTEFINALTPSINSIVGASLPGMLGLLVDGISITFSDGKLRLVDKPVPLASETTAGGFKIKAGGDFVINAQGQLELNYKSIKGLTTGVIMAQGSTAQEIKVGQTQDVNGCAIAVTLSSKSDLFITASAHPISASASDPAFGVLRVLIDNTAFKSAHGSSYSFKLSETSTTVSQVPNATHLSTVISGVLPGNHLIKLTWTTLGPSCCMGGIILNQDLFEAQTDIASAMANGLQSIDSQALKCDLIIDIKAALN